jgi:hypothetical protein
VKTPGAVLFEVNQGHQDRVDGENVRGVLPHGAPPAAAVTVSAPEPVPA